MSQTGKIIFNNSLDIVIQQKRGSTVKSLKECWVIMVLPYIVKYVLLHIAVP